jgi:DMSO reductase anchor subunit
MTPAYSVIFFTVSSGAGYGLLILLGIFASFGILPADRWFGFSAFALALTAITAGLLSSTLHLGHPERAWRAFSQWRSSWLSREGVLAVATYIPAAIFGLCWIIAQRILPIVGAWLALSATLTILCTAMIYASLKPVRRWRHPLTPLSYLTIGLASGALWLALLCRVFALDARPASAAMVLLLAAGSIKMLYWRSIDRDKGGPTIGSATGLGKLGTVRSFAAPHTSENYLLKEMGYAVARKHALQLRRIALIGGFFVPAVVIAFVPVLQGFSGFAVALVAVALNIGGALTERWLFFAEARHTVTLYYGA